jgi:hypothetical protein
MLLRVVEVGQDVGHREGVMVAKAPGERPLQLGQLGPRLALGQIRQRLPVAAAADQGRQHRPARGAEHLRGHRAELHGGVFERLVQPVGLALAPRDERLAPSGEIAQIADRPGRHQAAAQQAVGQQLTEPGGIGSIGLSPRHLRDRAGVDHQDAREGVLEA